MPEHQFSTKQERGHTRTRVTLRRGEVISLCRCWHSKRFPLCDGSHKDHEDNRGPVVVLTECDSAFLVTDED